MPRPLPKRRTRPAHRHPLRNAAARCRDPARPTRPRAATGALAKRLHVASSTPAARPRQPAWAAATAWPSRSASSTGRQSATPTVQATPRAVVQAASAGMVGQSSVRPPGASPGYRAPAAARPARAQAAAKRARLRATAAGSSPTLRLRFRLSQGAALTPPLRRLMAAPTPGGEDHPVSADPAPGHPQVASGQFSGRVRSKASSFMQGRRHA
jgi:hypothetical protein